MFKKGQHVKLEISDMSDRGLAVGRADGMAVFVPGGVPGDCVTAKLTKIKKRYAFGELVSVDKESSFRRKSFCIHRKECGGCPYGEIEYEYQLYIKEKQVRDKLIRIGGIKKPKVKSIIPMGDPLNYRNKAVFSVGYPGDEYGVGGEEPTKIGENSVQVGFFQRGSHDVFHCTDCRIQTPAAMAAGEGLRLFMEEKGVPPWSEEWQRGLVKNMVVKTGFETGQVMVVLVIEGKEIPDEERLIERLRDEIWDAGYQLTSVVVDDGKNLDFIAGQKKIEDSIGELEMEISPKSFLQVNPKMTRVLYDLVCQYGDLTGREKVLDLYCGVGSIGLYCADKAHYVLGIEEARQAILDANRNAAINGIVNARFLDGRAEKVLPRLLKGEGEKDIVALSKEAAVVILDPPAAGCHPDLLDGVIETNAERLVYMSCDPGTMARDIKILCEQGYDFIEATPVDNFPWTTHVETVVLMSRNG